MEVSTRLLSRDTSSVICSPLSSCCSPCVNWFEASFEVGSFCSSELALLVSSLVTALAFWFSTLSSFSVSAGASAGDEPVSFVSSA